MCSPSSDDTQTARTMKFCNIWCCVSSFYTPSPTDVKNNSFLAILRTIQEGASIGVNVTNHILAWLEQPLPLGPHRCSGFVPLLHLQTTSHGEIQQLINKMLLKAPKMARTSHPPKLYSLIHLILLTCLAKISLKPGKR